MHNFYSMCLISVLTVGYAQVKAFPAEVKCGSVGRRKGKIINGDVAQPAQIPWIVSIKERGLHTCGGTIISNRYILTAAHCFQYNQYAEKHVVDPMSNSHLSQYTVTLGDYSQSRNEKHSVTYTIEKMIFHMGYNRAPLTNDIALLKLNTDIEWTDFIRPICLPSEDIETSDKAIAAGWGSDIDPTITREDNSKLRYIKIKIFDNAYCNKEYSNRRLRIRLQKSQLCAGWENKTYPHDTNEGDSGGPLFMNFGGRQVLVGITSAGTAETVLPKAPGIYTRVFKYLNWIEEHTSRE